MSHTACGLPGRIVRRAGGGFEYAFRFRGGEGGEGYALLFDRLSALVGSTRLALASVKNASSKALPGVTF